MHLCVTNVCIPLEPRILPVLLNFENVKPEELHLGANYDISCQKVTQIDETKKDIKCAYFIMYEKDSTNADMLYDASRASHLSKAFIIIYV